ncbi:LacI family transcriptional regulator [Chromatiales bacterium (ex Bugula neritina AB1)]|nr:LacI family transcriptional regulator [Chromatiales bacterium (ex Bugula neritina AB1)]
MTVSRALRDDGSVSPATRARIMKIVARMNYVPDQSAGTLATKRSGFVATLVPSLNNSHFAESVQTLSDEVESIGLQLLLGHTAYSTAREEQLVESMLKRRPEVIVLPFDGHSPRTNRLLKQANVPVIEQWEIPSKPIDYTVGFSNREAARRMAAALIERGYRNIAFVSEEDDAWTRGAARRAGFEQAMLEAGLSTSHMVRYGKPPMTIEHGYEVGSAFKRYFNSVDCVFCVSDAPAFGVLSAFKSQNIRVPEDIAVVGFGNFEVSRFSSPAISTVEVDAKGIGRETGRLICRLLGGNEDPSPIVRHTPVDVQLRWRESTL